MKTTIFSIHDIRQIVQHVGLHALMDEMIERLTWAIEQFDERQTIIPTRSGFQYTVPQVGLIEWMPVMQLGQTVTVKMVGYHPANPNFRELPTILSTISTYDTRSGHLIGLADATFLTALRTGAASAVASRVMASPNSEVIGLIGAGAQAVTQLHALSRIYPIRKVLVYDIDPRVTASFAERVAFMDLPTNTIRSPHLANSISQADIICTATSVDIGCGPVFEDKNTKPWLHVNAVGADFPGKVEVPLSLLKRSIVCPDFLDQALQEGECQQLSPSLIGPSLVDVVQNAEDFGHIRRQISVFDSTGWALEDQVAMQMMLDYATDLGLGTAIDIESISDDPLNPYQFMTQPDDTPVQAQAEPILAAV